MSYILDALKRADSERERERDDVPGLHSKTDSWVAPDEMPHARSRASAWVWPLAAAGLLGLLGLVWFALTREAAPAVAVVPAGVPAALPAAPAVVQPAAPQAAAASSSSAVAPAPAAAPAPAPIAAPAPTPAVVAATDRAARPASTGPVPVPATPAQARTARAVDPVRSSASVQAAPAAAKSRVQTPPSVATAASASASTASTASSAEARLYTLSELPDDVRAGLPALTVGGAMYSKTPAKRMIIINGQVFREGDTLAPGLVLEQIKLKSAVLRVKGLRYGISY